jgi:hypothetical protein
MKCLKMFAIAVLAGAAFLAVIGASPAAAATVLCTEAANPCPVEKTDGVGTEIKASLSGTSKLTTSFLNIECSKSSINAKVTTTGETIDANVEGLTFEECNCEVKVLKKGTLQLKYTNGTNATVTSTGTEVTTKCSTIFGNVHCIYNTTATDLGTMTGGNPATTDTEGVNLPRLSTDSLCAEKANWDVKYEVTSPKPLFFEPNKAVEETALCTEAASPCLAAKTDGTGTEIKASLLSGTQSKLTTPYNNIECSKSSLTAKVTSTGKTIDGGIEGLSFEECNCEVKVLAKGTLELEHVAGSSNATVKSTGTEVTTLCSTVTGNVHCIYKTEATDLGTLEGGNPAKVKISGAEVPRLATDSRCSEAGIGTKWDAEYEVTSPKPLFIEPESLGPTILCTEKANPCPAGKRDNLGTEIKASLSGTSKLTTSFLNIECTKSSINATVIGTSEKIKANVESLSYESCNCEVKVLKNGTLELEHIAATDNATITSTGTEVTTKCSTIFGNVHCIYNTTATDLGTMTGGNPATTDTEGVNLPRLSTDSLCAEKANWDVKYEVTSPKPLFFEPE